jgi:hypothetical protein
MKRSENIRKFQKHKENSLMKNQDKKRTKMTQSQDDSSLSTPEAKAERLKRVRNLANLSRESICDDGTINLPTLISWEIGRFGGLTKKGADNVIARVAKEGVFVTAEWLLHEVGAGPEVQADYKKLIEKKGSAGIERKPLSENNRILEELILFKKLNDNAVDFIIKDTAMTPHYQPGDHVAGTKRVKDKIKSLVGYDCIVETDDGKTLVRNLQYGPTDKTFNLVSINLQSRLKNNIIYNVKLISAAPIVWHRRSEP